MSYKIHIQDSNYSNWEAYKLPSNNLVVLDINPLNKKSVNTQAIAKLNS